MLIPSILTGQASDVSSTQTIKYKYKYKYPSLKYEYKYKYQVLHLWDRPKLFGTSDCTPPSYDNLHDNISGDLKQIFLRAECTSCHPTNSVKHQRLQLITQSFLHG